MRTKTTLEHKDMGNGFTHSDSLDCGCNPTLKTVDLPSATDKLRAFAQEVLNDFHRGEIDVEDAAIKHGLMRWVEAQKPCKAGCWCDLYMQDDDWPTNCLRPTAALNGKKKTATP